MSSCQPTIKIPTSSEAAAALSCLLGPSGDVGPWGAFCRSLLTDALASPSDENLKTVAAFLGGVLKTHPVENPDLPSPNTPSPPSSREIMADCLGLIYSTTAVAPPKPEEQDDDAAAVRYEAEASRCAATGRDASSLLLHLLRYEAVAPRTCLRVLPIALCSDAQLLPNSAPTGAPNAHRRNSTAISIWNKRLKKQNTAMFYATAKFNLCREEGEGYARVASLLSSLSGGQGDADATAVREMIGTFDLDPNRVVDLVLHWCECAVSDGDSTGVRRAVRLLRAVAVRDALPHLLGLVLRSQVRPTDGSIAPIFGVCAVLAADGMVSVRDIAAHAVLDGIDPTATAVAAARRKYTEISKLGAISLNAKPDDVAAVDAAGAEGPGGDDARLPLLVALCRQCPGTQLGEMAALGLVSTLREGGCDPGEHSPEIVGAALTAWGRRVLDEHIEKMGLGETVFAGSILTADGSAKAERMEVDGEGDRQKINPAEIIEELATALADILAAIGAGVAIGRDPIFYVGLCRAFAHWIGMVVASIESKRKDSRVGESLAQVIYARIPTTLHVLRTFLLPSLSMFPYSPSASSEVWAVVALLPYPIRYALYDAWRGTGTGRRGLSRRPASDCGYPAPHEKTLSRVRSEAETGVACRNALKRISKENYRDMGKRLARSSHNNPIVVFQTVLGQIESYDNMIGLMVDSFKFMTKLSLDVLAHCILLSLGGGEGPGGQSRSKVKCKWNSGEGELDVPSKHLPLPSRTYTCAR